MNQKNAGQMLIGALGLLFVLTISIPAIIRYIQDESRWTVKEQRATRSFELAESAVEQGYQQLILSTQTCKNVEAGVAVAGYNFDVVYPGPNNATYEISFASGPSAGQATVIGVARDAMKTDTRAVRAVYAVPGAMEAAIYSLGGAAISGTPRVNWGPVVSLGSIDAAGRPYPRLFSASSIVGWGTSAVPPNTDNVHWWAFQTLAPAPQIDVEAYKAAAYSVDGSQPLGGGPPGSIYYYSGDLDPGADHFIDGTLIVMGSLTLHGHFGNGSISAASVPVPPTAWKEYGETAATWNFFRTQFDPSAPAAFPGLTSNYQTTLRTFALNDVFIHGFLYVGNALSMANAGTSTIYGSLYCGKIADLGGSGSSSVKLYYDPNVIGGIKVKNNALTRVSWQETSCHWSGANAVCP